MCVGIVGMNFRWADRLLWKKTPKQVQNYTELKGAKLRDSVRSRFAIAGDISETKFFPWR